MTQKTYVIADPLDCLVHDRLREHLSHMKELTLDEALREEYIDVVWSLHIIARKLYGIKCGIKNIIDGKGKLTIINKHLMHDALRDRGGEMYLAKTRLLRDFVNEVKNKRANVSARAPVIIRPIGAHMCSGRGIRITASENELYRAAKFYEAGKVERFRFERVIASEYITDIMTHADSKFHVRMYLLIHHPSDRLGFISTFCKVGVVMTAKKLYKQSDYANSRIHDTHGATTARNLYFPDALNLDPAIYSAFCAHIDKITAIFGDIMRGNTALFSEQKYGFEVFGVDLLIKPDGCPIIMECNNGVGYGPLVYDEGFAHHSAEYFDWIYDVVLRHYID